MSTLEERAGNLEAAGIFLGGPPRLFEIAGQKLLMTLLREGLTPDAKVLDVGCGCLRGGYWLIHFLDKGCYCGIEPNRSMLEAGRETLLEPGLADLKQPRFDNNSEFDFTLFGEKFDFFVARSVWTHASKQQIRAMLDGFTGTASPGAVFVTSYLRATLLKRDDYQGTTWIGRSHESDTPGLVRHSLRWIRGECAERGLTANEIRGREFNFGTQIWLRIKREAN